MDLLRRFYGDEHGDMAEAAITTPVIVLLMLVIINFGAIMYTAQAAENAANYGARRGSVAQVNAAGEAASAAAYAASQTLLGEYDVHIVAPGGIAGAELGVRVNYRVPNWIGTLGGLFPGLPRGEYFAGSTTATFRQEGW
jgi:hypothetical protein